MHIEAMLRALRGRGHEVLLVGPDLVDGGSYGAESAWVRRLKRWLPRALYELAELAYSGVDYLHLARAIRRFRPDVVYERYNLFFVSGVWARRRYRLPWLVEVNAPLFDERSAYGGIQLKALARWSERAVWRAADQVFVVTEVLSQRVQREGVPAGRITVTPNGVHPEAFANLPSRAQAKQVLGLGDAVVLGFTGFVREWHGLERVLDTMQRLTTRSHFLCVGDGPARAALEQTARAAGLDDCVTFTGVVEHSAIITYLNAFDVALQPDVVAYASPLKLFEYMAAGCSIVAPDRPNIREILTHDVNAWLFDPDAPGGFADAVARLASDPALRQRLGERARQAIHAQRLTWDGNAERVLACAARLVAASKPGVAARAPAPEDRRG